MNAVTAGGGNENGLAAFTPVGFLGGKTWCGTQGATRWS